MLSVSSLILCYTLLVEEQMFAIAMLKLNPTELLVSKYRIVSMPSFFLRHICGQRLKDIDTVYKRHVKRMFLTSQTKLNFSSE